MARNSPERELATECTKLLQFDGWRAFGIEPISRREWGKGTGEPGQPDYLYIRYAFRPTASIPPPGPHLHAQAEVLWIEWKSPRGTLKPHQKLWHDVERKRGALTAIAKIDFPATVEGFFQWYRGAGLVRRIRAAEPRLISA